MLAATPGALALRRDTPLSSRCTTDDVAFDFTAARSRTLACEVGGEDGVHTSALAVEPLSLSLALLEATSACVGMLLRIDDGGAVQDDAAAVGWLRKKSSTQAHATKPS